MRNVHGLHNLVRTFYFEIFYLLDLVSRKILTFQDVFIIDQDP